MSKKKNCNPLESIETHRKYHVDNPLSPKNTKKKIECMEDCCVQRREFNFSNKVTPEPSGDWYSSLFDTDRDLYFRIKQLLFKEIEEMIKEKRKETWKFYHEAQLWEEQKQAVRPYDEMLKALKTIKERWV